MGMQGFLDLTMGGTGTCAPEYGDGYVSWYLEARYKGSSQLAEWGRRFLGETARIDEDCKSLPDELAPCYGPVFVRHAAFAAKVLENAAEAEARLVAVMTGAKTRTETVPWATGSTSSRRTSHVAGIEKRL